MEGEFNATCGYYYDLTQLLDYREKHFRELLENALPYTGQTKLSELDAIMECNREVQQAKADAEKTADDMRKAERRILEIMDYFEMPRGTKLTGEIPELLEFEIWTDENDTIYIEKTKDLEPIPNPNIVTIRFSPPHTWED